MTRALGREAFRGCAGLPSAFQTSSRFAPFNLGHGNETHMVAYCKASDRPNVVLTRSSETPTVMLSPEMSEFRAHAFQIAVSKARELGWIA